MADTSEVSHSEPTAQPRPNLDGAFIRLRWAKKRIDELEAVIAEVTKREGDALTIKLGDDRPSLEINGELHSYPEDLPMLISEVLLHVRSALDYLVRELSAFGSKDGTPGPRTQFLIEDDPKQFAGQSPSRLKHLRELDIAFFESLQPYKGCDWTRQLRDLSNEDKHRNVPVTLRSLRVAFEPGPPTITERNTVKVRVKYQARLTVTFENGVAVLQVLRAIHHEAEQAVSLFRHLFPAQQREPSASSR